MTSPSPNSLAALILCLVLVAPAAGAAPRQPPPVEVCAPEPIRYVGHEQTDKRFYDGRLRHAVGVHKFQALRANRSQPPEGGAFGWTYNHQPYLAWWRQRFYLQYLSNPVGEHVPPGRTLLLTSDDGARWSHPQVVFPEYPLPEIQRPDGRLPAGSPAVMHQRMGFYSAPNGRFLTLGFYSYCFSYNSQHSPNLGQGLGRVVREIYPDQTLGPIYFIRYNRHAGWDETNTRFPFFKTSSDPGFVQACESLLADKLMTLQWWEEDRGTDGFFRIPLNGAEPKALACTHRPDGVVLGVWKTHAALSPDDGQSWTRLVGMPSLMTCGAKTWVQKTDDQRYALVYNHSATRRNRFPMVVMTSEDCRDFEEMLCLEGEVPSMRYAGVHKNLGSQYIRGIEESNGNPPGSHLWNTYSMNKEDIWVTRTRLPITGVVTAPVHDDFEAAAAASDLEWWNLRQLQWAPIQVVEDLHRRGNRCLELRDEEPYDYALAERAFPESARVRIEFRVLPVQVGEGVLEFEVQDRQGARPLKLRLDGHWLAQEHLARKADAHPINPHAWIHLVIELDCTAGQYSLALDGQTLSARMSFAEPAKTVERLLFRTGPWRGDVRAAFLDGEHGTPGYSQGDLPGADHRVPLSIYWIDDLRANPIP